MTMFQMNERYNLSAFPPIHTWPKMPPPVVWLMFMTLYILDVIPFALSCKFTYAFCLEILEER